MSVVYDNTEYDLIVNPRYGKYQPKIISPKIRFQADAGYVHQRDQFPVSTRTIPIEMEMLTDAERNMLIAWIEYKKSDSFWYVLPESLKPRPDGRIIPTGILCRIIDDEIPDEPEDHGYWKGKLTLESIGPPVTPTQQLVTGTLTQAQMRLALATDGYAGIYLPESVDLKPYRVDRISVFDSALKKVRGYAKAAGDKAVNMTQSAIVGGMTVPHNTNIDMPYNDFTLVWYGLYPDWAPRQQNYFYLKFTPTGGWTGFCAALANSGKPRIALGSAGSFPIDKTTTNAPSLTNGTKHRIVFVVKRETPLAAGSVGVFVDGYLFETLSIPLRATVSLANPGLLYISGHTQRYAPTTNEQVIIYNYALTADQVFALEGGTIAAADQWGKNNIASGSVTRANVRLSLIDGAAFADFSASGVLTDYLGHRLVVTDSTGKKAIGYIKAAGTGETYGGNLITAWVNLGGHPYETFTSSGPDITSAIETGSDGQASANPWSIAKGMAMKGIIDLTLNSGNMRINGWFNGTTSGYVVPNGNVANGVNNYYYTEPVGGNGGYLYINSTTASNFSAAFTLKQILTPSLTGVTIVSTPGGNTYNWAFVDPAFNFNDSGGYTYQIDKLGANLALEESGIGTADWQDSSTNNLNASYPASGYAVVRHYDIVSAPGGSIQNWETKETGFNGDDPSGYSYEVEYYQ